MGGVAPSGGHPHERRSYSILGAGLKRGGGIQKALPQSCLTTESIHAAQDHHPQTSTTEDPRSLEGLRCVSTPISKGGSAGMRRPRPRRSGRSLDVATRSAMPRGTTCADACAGSRSASRTAALLDDQNDPAIMMVMAKHIELVSTGKCWCGCETPVPDGSFFARGHDKAAESMLTKLEYGPQHPVAARLAASGYGGHGGKNLKAECGRREKARSRSGRSTEAGCNEQEEARDGRKGEVERQERSEAGVCGNTPGLVAKPQNSEVRHEQRTPPRPMHSRL